MPRTAAPVSRTPLCRATGSALATTSATRSSSPTMRLDSRSAPAWMRDSSNRSSIIKVSRSTSRRICEWYWDTSRGSTTTWSSSASAMARRPASGVRRSWLTQATSSRRLASRARSLDRAWASRSCATASSFGELGEFGRQRQLRGYVDAALADALHRRGKRPAGLDEPPAHEQGDQQPGQPGDGHQVEHVVALGRGAHHPVGDDAHPGERGDHGGGHHDGDHQADRAGRELLQRKDRDERNDQRDTQHAHGNVFQV